MEERVRKLNNAAPRGDGAYVLYWMRWNRRGQANHALTFAAGTANRLRLPLLVFESEDQGSDRQRQFVRDGASGNAAALRKSGAGYIFGAPGELADHAARAAAVVTDDWPATLEPIPPFDCEAYAVDSSCIVPAARDSRIAPTRRDRSVRKCIARFRSFLSPFRT